MKMAEEYGDWFGNIPLTEGEQRGITIIDDKTEDLKAKGEKCLVGRLAVAKKIKKDAFKTLIVYIWRTVGRVFFKEIQENLWLFEFTENSYRRKVAA
jgi:hypothetical protein